MNVVATSGWHARAFGSAVADLDLRFDAGAPQRTITALLAHCLRDARGDAPLPGELTRWSLARRLHALIAVRLAGEPGAHEPLQARCEFCGAEYEFDLALERCAEFVPDDAPLHWLAPDGRRLQLHLPCAADFEAWQARGMVDAQRLAAMLVDAVDDAPPLDGFELDAAWLLPLADAMAMRDPLNALAVDAGCPDCGHRQSLEIELESLLLHAFARQQRHLLDSVLRLAQALHWTESEIVALPAWRREFYLDRMAPGATLT